MIETAIKEDLFLDSKLIIPENRMDAIRIMNELHPVVGGQPTNEKNQPNDNNPILDLACTILNIHEKGIGVHADLRKIQNEPPKYFYGKGFMSGISNLKGNGILAVYGHWRDGSGRYAIKQFYYTDKEILWRNAISDTAWSQWFDVLTGNSDLDYNKLLNVPLTSTLSDDKTKIASIFAVNNVNRAVVTAQKTANTANENAVDAMNEAKKKVEPIKVAYEYLKNGGIYVGGSSVKDINFDEIGYDKFGLYAGSGGVNNPTQSGFRFVESKNTYSNGPEFFQWALPFRSADALAWRSVGGALSDGIWVYSRDTSNTVIDNKGVIHNGTAIPTDALLVGDYGLGSTFIIEESNIGQFPDLNNLRNFIFASVRTDKLAEQIANMPPLIKNKCFIRVEEGTSNGECLQTVTHYRSGLQAHRVYYAHNDYWSDWIYGYTTNNTTTDPSGFLRSFGNAVALTTDKLTSDLKVNRSDLVASAKYAYDVYQAALAADKKAVNAQTTANTAVANAKTAQARADSAFSKVKPISEGGTGATTAAQGRKNMGHGDASTRNVATSLESNGNTLVPLSLLFGHNQDYLEVTTERLKDVPYVNDTNQMIWVGIEVMGTNTYQRAFLKVNGITVSASDPGDRNFTGMLIAHVPPGKKYELTMEGDLRIILWTEFKNWSGK